MKAALRVVALSMLPAIAACASAASPTAGSQVFAFDFNQGAQDWSGLSATDGLPARVDPSQSIKPLPSPLDSSRRAFYQSVISDFPTINGGGMLMAKRQVDGLRPNTVYDAMFTVEIASDMGPMCFTPFGYLPAPGFFAGASAIEPQLVSNQQTMAPELSTPSVRLGAVTSGGECRPRVWALSLLRGSREVTTGAGGELWLSWNVGEKIPEFGMVAPAFYVARYNVRLTIQ